MRKDEQIGVTCSLEIEARVKAKKDWMFETKFLPQAEGKSITVRVWPPISEKNGAWSCRIQILGIGRSTTHKSFGLGPLQCLGISLEYIRNTIEATGIDYRFDGASFRELLPMMAPTQYGASLLGEVEEFITTKIQAEERGRTKKYSRRYPDYPFK